MDDIMKVKMQEVSNLLYQNHEKEGLAGASELIVAIKNYILQINVECLDRELLGLLRELINCYQQGDVIGLADCLQYQGIGYMNRFGTK